MNDLNLGNSSFENGMEVNTKPVRRFRVGSISMGVALVGAGVGIIAQQLANHEIADLIWLWWPIIFILLGSEILVYVLCFRKQQVRLHYDLMSVFIVGLLGMLCLGSTALSSTGMLQQIRYTVGSTQQVISLPDQNIAVGNVVKKVIVQSNRYQVQLDTTTDKAVHVFGTYRSDRMNEDAGFIAQAVQARTIGDTLYVVVNDPPRQATFGDEREIFVTIAVPAGLKHELRGHYA